MTAVAYLNKEVSHEKEYNHRHSITFALSIAMRAIDKMAMWTFIGRPHCTAGRYA